MSNINWKQKSHVSYDTCYVSYYVDKELGVECEITTRRTHNGNGVGNSKSKYYIKGQRKAYKTEQELIKALNNGN